MVTGLDARLARLHAADVEVRLLAARADADNARSQLLSLLAMPDTAAVRLTDSLVADRPAPCDESGCEIGARGDLRALTAGTAAAGLSVKGARAAQLPQLAAFGALTRHGHDTPFSSGSGDWTVGVGVTWALFPALSAVAAVRRARAEETAARSRLEAATRQAGVEVVTARRMLEAARAAVLVAAEADREAGVALDQARLRYRTGAAPITELLDVQATATNATLNHVSARRNLLLAGAMLDFAYGANDR